jgi:hypothetical protein
MPSTPFPTRSPTNSKTTSPTLAQTPAPTSFPITTSNPTAASPVPTLMAATTLLPSTDLSFPVYVSVLFDFYPQEIGWLIIRVDTADNPVVVGGHATGFYPQGTQAAQEVVFLEQGKRYAFTITDLGGDGLSSPTISTSIPGAYSVTLKGLHNGTNLVDGCCNFGSAKSHFFTMPIL